MVEKIYFELKGTVTYIGDLEHIPRQNIPDLYKRTISIVTEDEQKLFPEIRNRKLQLLEQNSIAVGDFVHIKYAFEGSEKNNKRYNNIYVYDIVKSN